MRRTPRCVRTVGETEITDCRFVVADAEVLLRHLGQELGPKAGFEDFSAMEGASELEKEMIQNRKRLIATQGKTLSAPMVTDEQWAAIRAYYMEHAPNSNWTDSAKQRPPLYAMHCPGLSLETETLHVETSRGRRGSEIWID